jgi:DNA-directed RNA polymerase subunit K/omega
VYIYKKIKRVKIKIDFQITLKNNIIYINKMPKKNHNDEDTMEELDEDVLDDQIDDIDTDELDPEIIEPVEGNDETKEQDKNDTDDVIEYNISEYSTLPLPTFKPEELKGSARITRNRMTKYEMVRILGERTTQLTLGAKPMVKNFGNMSYDEIAVEELKLGMTPFKVKRTLPNSKYELWDMDELKIEHLLSQLE